MTRIVPREKSQPRFCVSRKQPAEGPIELLKSRASNTGEGVPNNSMIAEHIMGEPCDHRGMDWGILKPIAYASQSLSPAEEDRPQINKEASATLFRVTLPFWEMLDTYMDKSPLLLALEIINQQLD
ncbi:hypothetical protein T265_02860 [Opisthorchis viverrini]|uniref:Uncharacterized protein n=1 Tax=Opisthorchis viverrini TaxID=6198 RepID=A0A074ZTN2_OPIVI|nr:hypothetical protein T265_02860 [Opisthorchis viverrini]KER30823.1 hypothetical protein T265_02860 [Opisthorchis viverrini]